MGNNVLPLRGGDAIRVFLQTPRSGVSARTVIGTLIAERVLDAAFLLSLFVLLAYVFLQGLAGPDGTQIAAILGGILLLGAAVALCVRVLGPRIPLVRRLADFLLALLEPTRRLLGRHGGAMALFTAGIWALEALTYLAVGKSTGVDMDAIDAAYLVALASVFVLIPSGPGYVGTLDAALLLGLSAIGTTGSEALSFLLMLRFVLFVPVTLVGLLFLVGRYGGLPTIRRVGQS